MKKNNLPVFTLVIGGRAGDGAKEATINIGRLVAKLGYEFFLSVDYPSLIRGGHNFARITFSPGKVNSDYVALDALVAFNEETIKKHKAELKKDAPIFLDAEEGKISGSYFIVPASQWAKEKNIPPLMRSAALLGAVLWYFGFDINNLNDVFKNVFGKGAEPNIVLAKMGYDFAREKSWPQINIPQAKSASKKIHDANEAFAEGLVAAGLDNYFAYPMTPSSSILHYLAKKSKDYKIKVVQPENEIAVINMALGAAFTGKRTAVASCGGGFALMLEAMAMAGITETPIVVADSQRAVASTGVPTRTGQGDLDFVRNLPGEYPRIVLAPGDMDESYALGGDAMNLAWQYQVPVVVLLDKQISESVSTVDFSKNKIKPLPHRLGKPGPSYKRYAFVSDGISPLCFPGDKDTVVKQSSYEHDENGWIADEPKNTQKMCEKRFAKTKGILKEMKRHEAIKIWGDKKAKNVLVFFGSTKGAVLEALKLTTKPIKAVQILWMEPFPADKFIKETKGMKKVICLENNYTGQLAKLIREKTGLEIKNNLRQYNSMPFMPEELAVKLNKLF